MNNSKILCRNVYDFSNQTKVYLNLLFIVLLIVFFDFSRCVKIHLYWKRNTFSSTKSSDCYNV